MDVKIYNTYPEYARIVREKVFIEEQGFSYDYDEIDDIATHIVLFDDANPVAACRVFRGESDDVYILGRLAVKKECRGTGLGRKTVEAAKGYVAECGGKSLILHSQLQAKGFYERLGFVQYGEIEYEEGCPHIWMEMSVE